MITLTPRTTDFIRVLNILNSLLFWKFDREL